MSPPSNISITEEELVQRLQQRDEAAMTILYDRYSAALYGIILRIIKSEVLAEDVLQESFVKIWTSFHQYDPERGRLFTWMVNITRNAAIDKIRSKEYRVSSKIDTIDNSPVKQLTSNYETKPDNIGVREIVEKLTPDQKKIIDMMYFDGYTQSEVAEELALPLGTVKTRTRAAMKMLVKLLS